MANKITDAAVKFRDGMVNVLTGLGTSVDASASGNQWIQRPVTQYEIETAFRTSWLVRKIHTVPTTDQVRPWRDWLAKPDQIALLEKEERRLGLRQKTRKALLFAKMYGGSAIIMGIADDNMSQPLDVNRVRQGGLSYIHVLTRYEITIQGIDMDPGSPTYGEPTAYIATGGGNTATIHPTRVVRFTNGDLPDRIAFAEQGWSDPLLMVVRDAVMNADAAQGNFAALTNKALTSILTVPGLTSLVSTSDGEQKFIQRTRVANAFRSMFNLNIVSGASRPGEIGETWEDNTFSFANVPEMGTWFVQMVAGAADVPITRLLGTSPGGMNSTGESDTENYWASLDAGRELELRPRMEMIDEVLIRSALGNRPPEIWFQWSPFEVDTEQTRATNAGLRATAINTMATSGTVPSGVLAKIAKASMIDSGDYPGAEDAYNEFEQAGGDLTEINPPPAPANDNPAMSAAIEGLVAQGKSASVAAKDAIALCDATPRTLYVCRNVLNVKDLQNWATEQGLGDLQPDLHCTIIYSRQPVDWLTMGSSWTDKNGDGSGKLEVTAGGPRVVEPLGDRTAVLMFASTDIQWRHEEMVRAGASHDFGSYIPHISLTANPVDLSKVTPYRGRIEFGPELFSEIKNDDNGNGDDT